MWREPQNQMSFTRSMSHDMEMAKPAKVSYLWAVINLIGHLGGTSLVFIALISFGWGLSFFVHWLNSIHPLPLDISEFVTFLELFVIYADALLCAILVFAGARKFVRELRGM